MGLATKKVSVLFLPVVEVATQQTTFFAMFDYLLTDPIEGGGALGKQKMS